MLPVGAEYQDRPENGLSCAACTLFRPPRSCEIVPGDISPGGWCKFFDPAGLNRHRDQNNLGRWTPGNPVSPSGSC
jgi:hypothetical protein